MSSETEDAPAGPKEGDRGIWRPGFCNPYTIRYVGPDQVILINSKGHHVVLEGHARRTFEMKWRPES